MKRSSALLFSASNPDRMVADRSEKNVNRTGRALQFVRCLTLLLAIGCTDHDVASDAGAEQKGQLPPRVAVTSVALQSMVSEMVGDAASVVLLPADQGASRLPSTDEIQQLQTADLILLSGAGYESWLQTVSLPKSRMADTSAAYQQQLLTAADTVTHQHGPRGADANDNLISKTWLAPEFAIAQARHAERRLVQLLPEHAEPIAARAQALVARLESIQVTVQQLAETTDNVTVFATTSDFAYLVQSLGWKLKLLSTEPDVSLPKNSGDGLRLIFVFQQHPAESLPERQASDAQRVQIDAIESVADESEQSFTDRMQQNMNAIRTALEVAASAAAE